MPRLLGALQEGARSIKPCLVHGDLWDENAAVEEGSGEGFVFDAGAFCGHNEYEIGNWRAVRHRFSGGGYVEGYWRAFPPSEPGGLSLVRFGGVAALGLIMLTTRQLRSGTTGICSTRCALISGVPD